MRRFVCLLFAVVVALPAVRSVSSVSPDNLETILSQVVGLQDTDGLWGDAGTDSLDARLAATRYAAGVLSVVRGTGLKVVVPQRKAVCVKLVSKGLDLPALHDVIAARAALKCSRKAGTKLLEIVQAGLNADDLESVYHAAQIGFTLLDENKLALDKLDFSVGVDFVNSLRTKTGSFRWTLDGPSSDVAAGLALQVLGGAFSRVEALHERMSPEMRKTAQTLRSLVARQEPTGAFAGDDHIASNVHASSVIWTGLTVLSSSLEERLSVDDASIRSLTGFMLQHAGSRDLPTLFHVLSALSTLSHNALHVPLIVSRAGTPGALDLEATDVLRVRVSNALGGFASAASVHLRSVTLGVGSSAQTLSIESDTRLTPVADSTTEYEFDLLSLVRAKRDALAAAADANAPEPGADDEEPVVSPDEQVMGLYSIAVEVAPKPSSGDGDGAPLDALRPATANVRVVVGTRLSGLKLSMYTYDPLAGKGENRVGEKRKAVYPQKIRGATLLTLTPLENVAIQFQLDAAIRPHQVMVRLMKTDAYDQQLFFVPTFRGAGKFKQGLDVHDAVWNSQRATSGVYDVSIVVGDPNLVESVAWQVAQLQVTVDEAAELPDDDAVVFSPRAEIRHMFGLPDARPSTLFAMLYSVVVLLPMVALVHWLRINGALHFQLPENPKDFLFAVAFLGSLLACLGALAIYWVKLNIFQLGKATVFLLAPAMGFTGYQALRAHATEREKMKYQ